MYFIKLDNLVNIHKKFYYKQISFGLFFNWLWYNLIEGDFYGMYFEIDVTYDTKPHWTIRVEEIYCLNVLRICVCQGSYTKVFFELIYSGFSTWF